MDIFKINMAPFSGRMFCISCLCFIWITTGPIHWSHVLSWEWRCSWSSADRRCSIYIWVINNFIANSGTSSIRGLMVYEWNNHLQSRFLSTCFLSKLHMLHGYQGRLDLYCWSPIWKQICIDLIITACITKPISPFHHFPQFLLVSKLPFIYWKASSYFTVVVAAAELWWHLSNMKVNENL